MTTRGPGLRTTSDRPDVVVRCLGGFELLIDGRSVDLTSLRPRARSVLHLLATHAPRPVHRDVLLAALWSDNDAESARRSLQVAVSSVRKRLESAGWRHGVERVGDGYALAVEPHEVTDVRAFQRAVDDARRAHAAGDHHRLDAAARQALEWYRGDLLTEEGSADWVVETRDALRIAAGATARLAATAAYQRGDMAEALTMAERGLQLDRFDDTMWNIVIDAHAARGETGAAARARRTYGTACSRSSDSSLLLLELQLGDRTHRHHRIGEAVDDDRLDARHVVGLEGDLLEAILVLERRRDHLDDRAIGEREPEQQLTWPRIGTHHLAAVLLLTGMHEHVLDVGGLDEADRHRCGCRLGRRRPERERVAVGDVGRLTTRRLARRT